VPASPLIATGAGAGILAANGDSASAALVNPDSILIPLKIMRGPVSLPPQTNSIKISLPNTGDDCLTVTPGEGFIDTAVQLREDDEFTLEGFQDGACLGTKTSPGVAYRLPYDGPAPKEKFSAVAVHRAKAKVLVCSDSGWSDNIPDVCRDA
jgi:hypothetical protein